MTRTFSIQELRILLQSLESHYDVLDSKYPITPEIENGRITIKAIQKRILDEMKRRGIEEP